MEIQKQLCLWLGLGLCLWLGPARSLSAQNYGPAARQPAGEAALNSLSSALDAGRGTAALWNKRLEALRSVEPFSFQPTVRVSLAPAAGYEGRGPNRVWLRGFGALIRQENKDEYLGYKYDSGGLILGYDRELEDLPGLTLGISGAWSKGDLKNNDGLAKSDLRSVTVGLYGSYEWSSGIFMDANLGYGRGDNKTRITLTGGGGRESDYDSESWQGGLRFGYLYQDPMGFRVIPSVGLAYFRLSQDGWQERLTSDPDQSAVAHWFQGRRTSFIEVPVQVRADMEIELNRDLSLTPELRLGLLIEAHRPDTALRMGFVGSDRSVMIYGPESGRNRFQIGAGVKARLTGRFDAFADYDLEIRQKYRSHNASLGLGLSF
ncbi:MAG: autotransporter outer membrane beta-barrel domain-containing protein [Candidatus Adiutrix sp.]|jgi:outer membrane autotransporter protein|nr:autotransporter outer membrane beta-barrel domain-containing protein [Candidatus Adiutrix sp.]